MRRELPTPTRGCAECGAPIRSWRTYVLCRTCIRNLRRRDQRDPKVTSLREYRRERDGKCVVCGGPYPDGTGCEFCPTVVA